MGQEVLERPDQRAAVEAFIAPWRDSEGGAERANYALFLTKLTDLLGAGAAAGQAEKAAGKPRFPAGDVERTAAVFAMLAASAEPIDAGQLAARFRQGRQIEPQIRATLEALARMGHLAAEDNGRRFVLRRVS